MINIQRFGGRGASSSGNTGWNALKRTFKDNLVTDGINQVQLNGREQIEKIFNLQNSEYVNAREMTLDKLNNSPIAIYFQGQYGEYMNVYKNRKEMFDSIKKEYGGFKEYTGGNTYSISYVGKGEFYLTRDKTAKGGWKWIDGSGDKVESSKQDRKYRWMK